MHLFPFDTIRISLNPVSPTLVNRTVRISTRHDWFATMRRMEAPHSLRQLAGVTRQSSNCWKGMSPPLTVIRTCTGQSLEFLSSAILNRWCSVGWTFQYRSTGSCGPMPFLSASAGFSSILSRQALALALVVSVSCNPVQ